jgi:hypothetical protein
MVQTVTAPAVQHPAPSAPIHLIAREFPRGGGQAACCGQRSDQLLAGGHRLTPDPGAVTCPQWTVWRNAAACLADGSRR